MRRRRPQGFTLVELIIVMVVTGIVSLMAPSLLFHGVKTMVFLPKALAANQVAMEVTQQIMEGGFSTLAGQTTVRGLRFAGRRSASEPAIWLAETNRIGFLTSDGQRVVVWLEGGVVKRRLRPDATCPPPAPLPSEVEDIPYDTSGITLTGPLFAYYNQSGSSVSAPGCASAAAIRRVDLEFVAQTGSGVFDEGQARQSMKTSVAIRVP